MTIEYAEINRQYASDKNFLNVTVDFLRDGKLMPIQFDFEGRKIKIDRVTNVIPTASTKQGGPGYRYTCLAAGRQFHLYFDSVRWYIERE